MTRGAINRWSLMRIYAFFVGAFALAGVLTAPVSAQLASDVSMPSFPPVSITGGEVNGHSTFSVDTRGATYREVAIDILQSDDRVIASEITQPDTPVSDTVSLSWDTTRVYDGNYVVRYRVIDQSGAEQSQQYPFKVTNGRSFVVLDTNPQQNSVSGRILRQDARLSVFIDGGLRGEVPVTATMPDDSGMFAWSVLLGASAADGAAHHVEVRAIVPDTNEVVARSATMVLSLTLPVVATPSNGGITAPADAPLQLAEEMGQFVAPPLQTTKSTQFYGVSVSDLVNDTPKERNIVAVDVAPPTSEVIPLEGSDARLSAVGQAPIQASERGWMVLGFAWYWWLGALVIMGAIGGVFVRPWWRRSSRPLIASRVAN